MKKLTITLAFFAFTVVFGHFAVSAFDEGRYLLGTTLAGAFLFCAVMGTGLVLDGEDA